VSHRNNFCVGLTYSALKSINARPEPGDTARNPYSGTKKMIKQDKTAQYAKNIVEDVIYQLGEMPDIFKRNRAENKRGLEIDNCLRLSLSCIKMMSIHLRYYHDANAARDALGKALWAARQAADAFEHYDSLNEIGASPVHSTEFPNGIAAAWLSGDWVLAERLGIMALHKDLYTSSGEGRHGSTPDLYARIYAALATDNKALFEECRGLHDDEREMKKNWLDGEQLVNKNTDDSYAKYFYIYPALMQSIFEQDSLNFMKLLAVADKLFAQRAKDKSLSDFPSTDGPPGFNPLMIDYKATALAQLALHRGMAIDFETSALPINTIHAWIP
jgi:hypothetical protein